jgi:hypothetical protein
MAIDKKLVDMLSLFMEKTGSAMQDVRSLTGRMYKAIDQRDQQKVASVSAHRDRAGALALKLSETRLPSGAPFIEGYDQVKQASALLEDHDKALDVFEMVLDLCNTDHSKVAAVEPGYPISASTNKTEDDMTADEWLVYKTLGPNAINR